jgi:hypothetical protein
MFYFKENMKSERKMVCRYYYFNGKKACSNGVGVFNRGRCKMATRALVGTQTLQSRNVR